MHAMQYKISFPIDFDMNSIRKRVSCNGSKTDGFSQLLLKAYLILDTKDKKEYSPLYIWEDYNGMNTFIFDGFYDNILESFGWQTIQIAIPIKVELESVSSTRYVLEIQHIIQPSTSMTIPKFSLPEAICSNRVLVYNPDKWKSVAFYFFEDIPPQEYINQGQLYEILHISL